MMQPPRLAESQTGLINPDLMGRAIAGVLRNAQEGELPLFAWTLGLPQPALLAALEHCFPELVPLEPMATQQYVIILNTQPAAFGDLVAMLCAKRSPHANEQHAEWLARAIAAACFGNDHLWRDMGLPGRDEVSQIMEYYFEPCYRRNMKNLKWKRFLFAELGDLQGKHDLRPPGCSKCDHFQVCFATS